MFIYNVTVKVESDIAGDWLDWMKKKHIADVMDTGFFSSYKICKLVLPHEDDGITFAIQYSFKEMADLQQYQAKHAKALQEEHTNRFKDKFVAFRTVLELV